MSTPIASTVLKAFEVLDLLSRHDGLSVQECAEELGIPRSTAYRLLATLRAAGAVEVTDNRFRVGVRMIAMGLNSPVHRRLVERSSSRLHSLAAYLQVAFRLSRLFARRS